MGLLSIPTGNKSRERPGWGKQTAKIRLLFFPRKDFFFPSTGQESRTERSFLFCVFPNELACCPSPTLLWTNPTDFEARNRIKSSLFRHMHSSKLVENALYRSQELDRNTITNTRSSNSWDDRKQRCGRKLSHSSQRKQHPDNILAESQRITTGLRDWSCIHFRSLIQ